MHRPVFASPQGRRRDCSGYQLEFLRMWLCLWKAILALVARCAARWLSLPWKDTGWLNTLIGVPGALACIVSLPILCRGFA